MYVKFIGVVTRIFPMKFNEEVKVAFSMATAALFTLIGYEFIRSSSTVLFKSAYGADKLPLVMAAMPVVVFWVSHSTAGS